MDTFRRMKEKHSLHPKDSVFAILTSESLGLFYATGTHSLAFHLNQPAKTCRVLQLLGRTRKANSGSCLPPKFANLLSSHLGWRQTSTAVLDAVTARNKQEEVACCHCINTLITTRPSYTRAHLPPHNNAIYDASWACTQFLTATPGEFEDKRTDPYMVSVNSNAFCHKS